MTGPERLPRLTTETFHEATVVQIGRYALWVGVVVIPAMILSAVVLGLGAEMSASLGDQNTGMTYRGGTYSYGAAMVGLWVFMVIALIGLYRNKTADRILERASRLEELRRERGNKAERRAAGMVAADFAIPEDETISSRRLRVRAGCPTLIRLSAGHRTWLVRRTDTGWVYVQGGRSSN